MEIKATLNKPYTDKERNDFIVLNNRKQGFEIKETETALLAFGYTNEEIEAKKRENISNLTCTKRVFVLMLQELGISYHQLKELIEKNNQAQLEWELCVELKRSNSLIDVMAAQLNITPQMIDKMFLFANDLITHEEFINNDKMV